MFKVEGKLVIDNSIGDTTPVVSVLMPVYNAQLYVEKAIKSILTQTFIDFEFIILDDGSTDNSLNILEQYAKQDIRIRIISRENKGLIVSLNELVEQARGQYVARMDADDISRPERFAMQVDFLSKNTDHIVVGSSIEKINEKGQIGRASCRERVFNAV